MRGCLGKYRAQKRSHNYYWNKIVLAYCRGKTLGHGCVSRGSIDFFWTLLAEWTSYCTGVILNLFLNFPWLPTALKITPKFFNLTKKALHRQDSIHLSTLNCSKLFQGLCFSGLFHWKLYLVTSFPGYSCISFRTLPRCHFYGRPSLTAPEASPAPPSSLSTQLSTVLVLICLPHKAVRRSSVNICWISEWKGGQF